MHILHFSVWLVLVFLDAGIQAFPVPFFLKKRKGIHVLCAPRLTQTHFACGSTNQLHNYSANQSAARLWLWDSQTRTCVNKAKLNI